MSRPAASKRNLPIGVFDSGVGGLTVLAALRERLPEEDLLYLGDTARVPYGPRGEDTVRRYAMRVAGHLHRRGIKALVIACNTATTWALPALEAAGAVRGVPVIGVIRPGVELALTDSPTRHVAVIGTEGTINGGRYVEELRRKRPGLEVSQQACPLFVALAEEGWIDDPVTRMVAERYLGHLRGGPDTIILGCTHYPLLAEVIAETLPGVRCIDSAVAVAEATARLLDQHQLRHSTGHTGSDHFLVTDHLSRFQDVGTRLLGRLPAPAEVVHLADSDDHEFGAPGLEVAS